MFLEPIGTSLVAYEIVEDACNHDILGVNSLYGQICQERVWCERETTVGQPKVDWAE